MNVYQVQVQYQEKDGKWVTESWPVKAGKPRVAISTALHVLDTPCRTMPRAKITSGTEVTVTCKLLRRNFK